MKKEKLLDGAWEEYGVIGTRIEINDSKFTVLWRNSPVLVTNFKRLKKNNGLELILDKKGLRYEYEDRDYATLEKVLYQNEKLEITENFPISGKSHTILQKTQNSRFGNYKIVDDVLQELEGKWEDENGFYEMTIVKDELSLRGEKIRIHVLHSNSIPEEIKEYKIVNQDPSKMELLCFFKLEYRNGILIGYENVYDASPLKIILKKNKCYQKMVGRVR